MSYVIALFVIPVTMWCLGRLLFWNAWHGTHKFGTYFASIMLVVVALVGILGK